MLQDNFWPKKFVVRQEELGLSECERLCGRTSREIEELASRSGGRATPGTKVRVPLGTALNMLVLSIAASHSIEPQAMAAWLPGLRDEAVLELGQDTSNWAFEGTYEAEKQFWPILYGDRDTVRSRIASMLACYSGSPTRELWFFSPSDVECVSATSCGQRTRSRSPRFIIDAHDLAARVKAVCGSPLFTAEAMEVRGVAGLSAGQHT